MVTYFPSVEFFLVWDLEIPLILARQSLYHLTHIVAKVDKRRW